MTHSTIIKEPSLSSFQNKIRKLRSMGYKLRGEVRVEFIGEGDYFFIIEMERPDKVYSFFDFEGRRKPESYVGSENIL